MPRTGSEPSQKGIWPVLTGMRLLLSLLFSLLKQSQFAPNKQVNERRVLIYLHCQPKWAQLPGF